MTVEQLFDGLIEATNMLGDYGYVPHMNASFGSSEWTSRIVQYLQDVTNGELLTLVLCLLGEVITRESERERELNDPMCRFRIGGDDLRRHVATSCLGRRRRQLPSA